MSIGLGLQCSIIPTKQKQKRRLPQWFKLYCPEITIYNPNSLHEHCFAQLLSSYKVDSSSRILNFTPRYFFKSVAEVFVECIFGPGHCLVTCYKYIDNIKTEFLCRETDRHIHILGSHNPGIYYGEPCHIINSIEFARVIPRTHTIKNPNFKNNNIKRVKRKLIF